MRAQCLWDTLKKTVLRGKFGNIIPPQETRRKTSNRQQRHNNWKNNNNTNKRKLEGTKVIVGKNEMKRKDKNSKINKTDLVLWGR